MGKLIRQIFTKKLTLLTAFAALLELIYLGYLYFNLSSKNIPAYMLVYACCFIIYLASVWCVKYKTKILEPISEKGGVILIILFAAVFRLTLLPAHITTSDDVYRYIWEGKVLYNGYNPYQYPPGDTALVSLHSAELQSKVAFHTFAAIYPPLSQVLFAVNYIISGENELGLKFIFLICEIVTMIFITMILREKKKPGWYVIYYAWLPLPVMEYFVNSHIDPVGIMFFVMFVYYSVKDKAPQAAVAFAFSFLSKLYPVFLLPLVLKKFGIKRTLLFGVIVASIVILGFIPFLPKDRFVGESLLKYMTNWQFNASFYYMFLNLLHNGYHAKIICNALLLLTVCSISIFYKDFVKAVCYVLIAVIAFSATMYPWYLGWVAAVNPVFGFYSVMSFLFLVNLSNLTPLSAGWKEYWWVLLLEYVPFYLFLILDINQKMYNGTDSEH